MKPLPVIEEMAKVMVLRVLKNRQRGLSIAKIARKVRSFSYGTIRKHCAKLEKEGLLASKRQKGLLVYKLRKP